MELAHDVVDYPTVTDGVRGVKFIHAVVRRIFILIQNIFDRFRHLILPSLLSEALNFALSELYLESGNAVWLFVGRSQS
jgi:hypothetical protein